MSQVPSNFLDPSVDVAPWAANYDSSADPYNYGSPGNAWYSGQGGSSASGGGLSFSGFGDTLLGLAGIAGGVQVAKVKAETPLYSRGPNGQLYREGVPVGTYQSGIGGISPLMLLILAGVAIFAMKD